MVELPWVSLILFLIAAAIGGGTITFFVMNLGIAFRREFEIRRRSHD